MCSASCQPLTVPRSFDSWRRNKKMGALDVRCFNEIHTIRYLNYLLNISHDSFIPLLWLVISPKRRSPKKHKLNALANIVDSYTDVQTKERDWINGHTDNTKSFLVTKILEGSKRKNSPKADFRLPVSMNLLKRLIQSLPFVYTSVYESTMFASAFPGSTLILTSYFTNAEKSEKTQTERACEHSRFVYWRINKRERLN
jgi:hypothetical protein